MHPFRNDDTIVAVGTPVGTGAVAVIRISGPKTFEILSHCFSNNKILTAKSHHILYGYIMDGRETIDEVLVAVFRAPHSYTKEDSAELSCHGSLYIQRSIVALLIKMGARMATPGEFTQRAYLNGRFNLLQAEAVADLIASESAAQHRLALTQMKGGFSSQLAEMREELISLTALLELELDFAEEDVEFASREQLLKTGSELRGRLQALSRSFKNGEAIKKGIPIAITGPPNVGKSTLLNHLLQEEKAIVSDIPGTTRDVIEDTLVMDGVLFRLIDTAGIRSTDDVVEGLGIERSKKMIRQAQLVLLLYEEDTPFSTIEAILDIIREEGKPWLPVHTKADLNQGAVERRFDTEIQISAKTGYGIDHLKKAVLEHSGVQLGNYDATVSNIRHYEALNKADEALEKAMTGIQTGLSGELIAEDLREALYYIGSITGEVVPDDILGTIFSRFCIGK